MINREGNRDKTVYVLPIFEIEANLKLPNKKSDLVDLIQNSSVIVFHKNFCAACHTVPHFNEWLKNQQNEEGTKGQTIPKAKYVFLNSPKKRTNLTILNKEEAQDSEFCSFFGRIEEIIICV